MSSRRTRRPPERRITTRPEVKITDEVRPIAELTADPKNARRHPEQQIARIASSIEQFGYVNKITIRPTGQIIGGHATLDALKRLARDPIEVRVVAGLTEAQYAALALALNKLPEGSSWDEAILAEVIGELEDAGEDPRDLGFSDGELSRLRDVDDPIEVREIETGEVDDEFWISIRGPLKVQAEALKALEDAMRPFGDVSVDLGTINVG